MIVAKNITKKFGKLKALDNVSATFSKGECIALLGPNASGKTTLIKSICHKLGVTSVMTSPTFSIVNEYTTFEGEKIYHFDFYRLKKETEAYDIGVEEYFESGRYCFVEWPEFIPSLIPQKHIDVWLTDAGQDARTIACNKYE